MKKSTNKLTYKTEVESFLQKTSLQLTGVKGGGKLGGRD